MVHGASQHWTTSGLETAFRRSSDALVAGLSRAYQTDQRSTEVIERWEMLGLRMRFDTIT